LEAPSGEKKSHPKGSHFTRELWGEGIESGRIKKSTYLRRSEIEKVRHNENPKSERQRRQAGGKKETPAKAKKKEGRVKMGKKGLKNKKRNKIKRREKSFPPGGEQGAQ